MRFLTPLYLSGAALIALPIILHWLRRDVAPRVPFTAIRLLQRSAVDRSRRRRLRDLLLLAARVLALLLLAASFARPYVLGSHAPTRAMIVAIDRSFSMTAPQQMTRARLLARQSISDAETSGEQVAVIAFDQRADVVFPLGSAADARLVLEQIEPGFEGTRYASAFDKTAELLAAGMRARLIVITDLQRSGFDGRTATLPDGVELAVRDVGAPATNLAVTEARVGRGRLTAVVRDFGTVPRETDVRLRVDGTVRATRHVGLMPGGSAEVLFDLPSSGAFDVTIDDGEGYAADNVRYGLAAARSLARVLIVAGPAGTHSGFYMSRALQAGTEDGADFDVRVMPGQAFASLSPTELRQTPVVALLSTHGIDRRARETVRPFLDQGGGLFIAAGPDVDASVLSTVLGWNPPLRPRERSGAGVLAATDLKHPIFRPFDAVAANLGQVSFQRLWQIDPGVGWQVLARYTDGAAAVLEREEGRGRVLLFTSDVDRQWNSFPLHPAFVPFVQEAVRYLGARESGPSSLLVSDVPAGVPRKPGILRIAGRTVAINVDTQESSVDRIGEAEFSRVGARPLEARPSQDRGAEQAERRQNYWRYGLILMLGALIAESFVGAK